MYYKTRERCNQHDVYCVTAVKLVGMFNAEDLFEIAVLYRQECVE